MIKLFIIDDHFLILEGMYKAFDTATDGIELIGSAQNMEEALEKLAGCNPDIIVLDLFIHDSLPAENFKLLHNRYPSIPIVILTMEDSLRWQIKMFKMGVMGFLNKSETKENMKSVFVQVAHGNMVIPDTISKALISKSSGPR